MQRRRFTQMVGLVSVGAASASVQALTTIDQSSIETGLSRATFEAQLGQQFSVEGSSSQLILQSVTSEDCNPEQQFHLVFDVVGALDPVEQIYFLRRSGGVVHGLHLTPVEQDRFMATFNLQANA